MVNRKSGNHQPCAAGQEQSPCASNRSPYRDRCDQAHEAAREEREPGTVDQSALIPRRPDDYALNSTVALLRAVVAAEIYRLSGQLPEWTRDES